MATVGEQLTNQQHRQQRPRRRHRAHAAAALATSRRRRTYPDNTARAPARAPARHNRSRPHCSLNTPTLATLPTKHPHLSQPNTSLENIMAQHYFTTPNCGKVIAFKQFDSFINVFKCVIVVFNNNKLFSFHHLTFAFIQFVSILSFECYELSS